jgi:hypothetical protein
MYLVYFSWGQIYKTKENSKENFMRNIVDGIYRRSPIKTFEFPDKFGIHDNER